MPAPSGRPLWSVNNSGLSHRIQGKHMSINETVSKTITPLIDRYWRGLPGNFRGAFWMMLSALAFIAVQSVSKELGGKFDSFQIAFFRAFFGGLAVLPFLFSRGFSAYKTSNLPFHIGRGVFGAIAIYLMVYAVIHMPLADATVIGFTRTFFMIIFAVIFLGEMVRWRRWAATAVGFSGVLLMLRPGDETFQLAALAAVGASVCFASAHVCIKKCTTRKDHPMTIQTYYWTIATIVTFVPALLVWVNPTTHDMMLMVLVGLLSGIAQTLLVYSLNAGEATFVHPFDFTRLIWAALAGWLIFSEPLSIITIAGAAIIISSNVYIARRQLKENKEKAAAEAAKESGEKA
jgi:drug/metabolite transporter (DMT)-like permease